MKIVLEVEGEVEAEEEEVGMKKIKVMIDQKHTRERERRDNVILRKEKERKLGEENMRVETKESKRNRTVNRM